MSQPRIEPSTNLDRELSERTAEAVRAAPKDCYRNAVMALFTLAEVPELAEAEYVEGSARPHDLPIPFEHGWLELPDGRVVDPTWVLLHTCVIEYYAGERYSRQQVLARLAEKLPLAGWGTRATHTAHYWALREAMGGDSMSADAEAMLRKMYHMDEEPGA